MVLFRQRCWVESLTTLFAELGGLEVADASRMAQGVEDYRYQYPGFRYREELLAVEGVSRLAYDQVKEFVPLSFGAMDASYAAGPLSALANDSQGDDDNASDDALHAGRSSHFRVNCCGNRAALGHA